eukprot:3901291-Pleurochrysis_carterae.AAC.4
MCLQPLLAGIGTQRIDECLVCREREIVTRSWEIFRAESSEPGGAAGKRMYACRKRMYACRSSGRERKRGG